MLQIHMLSPIERCMRNAVVNWVEHAKYLQATTPLPEIPNAINRAVTEFNTHVVGLAKNMAARGLDIRDYDYYGVVNQLTYQFVSPLTLLTHPLNIVDPKMLVQYRDFYHTQGKEGSPRNVMLAVSFAYTGVAPHDTLMAAYPDKLKPGDPPALAHFMDIHDFMPKVANPNLPASALEILQKTRGAIPVKGAKKRKNYVPIKIEQ